MAGLAALGAVMLGTRSAPALEIVKLRAMATADSVRIEVVPKAGEDFADAEFTARITRTGNDRLLWRGSLGRLAPGAAKGAAFIKTLSGLKPDLWSPASPVLYNLTVSATKDGTALAPRTVRIGFRSFEIKDGQFRLNGRPVFLRGIAINPPGRSIPPEVGESRAFAEAYVRYLKSQNVNIFRLSTDGSQVWFDVCDELGMMMYAGHYGLASGSGGGQTRCAEGCRSLHRRLPEAL